MTPGDRRKPGFVGGQEIIIKRPVIKPVQIPAKKPDNQHHHGTEHQDIIKTAEQLQQLSLKETDIKNAVEENMAAFITQGVTDESWGPAGI